jgi:hypothetical protein
MKLTPVHRRHWVLKQVSGICGVGKMMNIWKKRETDECPRCGEMEDAVHVLECPDPEAITQFEEAIDNLHKWLEAQCMAPEATELICQRLLEWRHGEGLSDVNLPQFLGLQEALKEQDAMGWRAFLEGCLVWEWESMQQRYYGWLGK